VKRFLTFILLLIVTAATVTPCCVYDDCAAEQTAGQKKESNKDDGACSPFFSCSSCSGFVWTFKPMEIAAPVVVPKEYYEQLSGKRLPSFSASFWQPPRNLAGQLTEETAWHL